EEIEDSLSEWMPRFVELLNLSAGKEIEKLHAVICEIGALYIDKYEEEFASYNERFVSMIWALLTRIDASETYDDVAIKAMGFLTSAVRKEWNRKMFANPDTLKGICERVVIPNIRLRESDLELFEANGLEYVRRDMEGSDNFTRRRSACDLVRGLT